MTFAAGGRHRLGAPPATATHMEKASHREALKKWKCAYGNQREALSLGAPSPKIWGKSKGASALMTVTAVKSSARWVVMFMCLMVRSFGSPYHV